MKTRKELILLGIIAIILSHVFRIPELCIFSCIFITGSMVIKGVKENDN